MSTIFELGRLAARLQIKMAMDGALPGAMPVPKPIAVPKPIPSLHNYSQYKNQDPASRARLDGQLKDIQMKSYATEPSVSQPTGIWAEERARLRRMGRGLAPNMPGWNAYQDASNEAQAGLEAAVKAHHARATRAQWAKVREYLPHYTPDQ